MTINTTEDAKRELLSIAREMEESPTWEYSQRAIIRRHESCGCLLGFRLVQSNGQEFARDCAGSLSMFDITHTEYDGDEDRLLELNAVFGKASRTSMLEECAAHYGKKFAQELDAVLLCETTY